MFHFLDDRFLILVLLSVLPDPDSLVSGSLLIPELHVVDLEQPTDAPLFLVGINSHNVGNSWSFSLPALGKSVDCFKIIMESASSLSHSPGTSALVPFMTSCRDRLFALNLHVSERGRARNIALCFRSSAIISFIQNTPTRHHYPWSEWGPDSTRVLDIILMQTWPCFAHGMQLIYFDIGTKFQLYDFNPLSLGRNDGLSTDVIVDFGTTFRDPSVFRSPVTTHLPYRVRTGFLPPPIDPRNSAVSLMLGEDGIVTVSVSLCASNVCDRSINIVS